MDAISNMPAPEAPKVLIVEDEMLVALNLQSTLIELGYAAMGIAPDAETALALAKQKPDIALVDVNLRDGKTGPEIGEKLAQNYGATVLFVTANPRQLGDGVPGAVGVINKPYDDHVIGAALAFVSQYRAGEPAAPPSEIMLFGDSRAQYS